MSRVFEDLADPTRRTIVERLAREQMTAGQIADLFDVARPGVSRHLRVLREAGLVEAEAVAQRRVYRLAPTALDDVEQWCRSLDPAQHLRQLAHACSCRRARTPRAISVSRASSRWSQKARTERHHCSTSSRAAGASR